MGRHGGAIPKAGRSVAKVEVDAPLARLMHVVVHCAVFIDDGELAGKDVGVDISWAQVLEEEIGIGALGRARPKVNHHRHFTAFACLDSRVNRGPRRMLVVKGLGGPIVGGFDADAHLVVGCGHLGCLLRIEVGDDLFGRAHARGGNVDIGEHADLGVVDHRLAEVLKLLGPGRARIDAGGYTLFEKVGIGVETAHQPARLAGASMVRVDVDVEQARHDDEIAHIDDAVGIRWGNVRFNAGDAAVEYADVGDAVDVVDRVDYVAAFE